MIPYVSIYDLPPYSCREGTYNTVTPPKKTVISKSLQTVLRRLLLFFYFTYCLMAVVSGVVMTMILCSLIGIMPLQFAVSYPKIIPTLITLVTSLFVMQGISMALEKQSTGSKSPTVERDGHKLLN